MARTVRVVVPTPAHSQLSEPLTYASELPLAAGCLVRVPLGTTRSLWCGLGCAVRRRRRGRTAKLKAIGAPLSDLPPLSANWRQLVTFAANYYQRSLGEVALAALPPQLRELDAGSSRAGCGARNPRPPKRPIAEAPMLTPEQAEALAAIEAEPGPFLLFGATGSGKTEVYLRAVQTLLEREPGRAGAGAGARDQPHAAAAGALRRALRRNGGGALHSGMTNPQRLRSWLAAHAGQARIVLGTRMAIFASLPRLRLIVVDEEHDPSYKQQEGARYSARDLACTAGGLEGAQGAAGLGHAFAGELAGLRPRPLPRLAMPSRVGAGALPRVRLVDMNHQPKNTLFSAPLLAAIRERIARGEQSLVFLNRRGYAPVLACGACDWRSDCPHCSAYRVFHKIDRTLRCHHCGYTERVPRACPACGNVDIAPLGRGTERLEEQLAELLPTRAGRTASRAHRPHGCRQHAPEGRAGGTAGQVHSGEVDVLVGTQMVTKGHDFRRITLVAAVNPDGALFSSDFRAPERLFSLLMQAAGRAGRDAAQSGRQRDVGADLASPAPAVRGAEEARLPGFRRTAAEGAPAGGDAAVRVPGGAARRGAHAGGGAAVPAGRGRLGHAELDGSGHVTVYSPVPMTVQRVANVERAQLLLESGSRAALQAFL
jgi:primosomal protein N' (replication factor Y)